VAWRETKPTTIRIGSAEKAYDYVRRQLSPATKIELTRTTILVVLTRGGSKDLKIVPSPVKPTWLAGAASSGVLLGWQRRREAD
jgi:hypothetical protein